MYKTNVNTAAKLLKLFFFQKNMSQLYYTPKLKRCMNTL